MPRLNQALTFVTKRAASSISAPFSRRRKRSVALVGAMVVLSLMLPRSGWAAEEMLPGSMIAPVGTTGLGTGVNENNRNLVATIKQRGVVNIGVKADIKGLGYQDSVTGEFSGLEVELGKRIAADLGVEVHFVAVGSATRTELLDQGMLDLVMGTMTITPQRLKQWDFTLPYFSDHAAVLVEDKAIKSIADLKGKTIAVTVKTNSALALVQELMRLELIAVKNFDPNAFEAKTWNQGISFKEYDTPEQAQTALAQGEVAGFCNDRSQVEVFLTAERHILPEIFAPQPFGVATPKYSDLSAVVDRIVLDLMRSGELADMTKAQGLPVLDWEKFFEQRKQDTAKQ